MQSSSQHAEFVDAWFERTGRGLSSDGLIRLFSDALAAVWRRSFVTLGEVTLTAVMERVLYTSREAYPWLRAAQVGVKGVVFEGIGTEDLDDDELKAGLRSILVGFLTILENLTGSTLTPKLHQELLKMDPAALNSANRGRPKMRSVKPKKGN